MHQESRGAKEALRQGDLIIWTAEDTDGSRYAAIFNIGDSLLPLELDIEQIGLGGNTAGTELWSGAPAELTTGVLRTNVSPHGVRLYRFF